MNLETISSGKLPKGAKALKLAFKGISTATQKTFLIAESTSTNGIYVISQVAGNTITDAGWIRCDSNGDFITYVNTTWTSVYLAPEAVQVS